MFFRTNMTSFRKILLTLQSDSTCFKSIIYMMQLQEFYLNTKRYKK